MNAFTASVVEGATHGPAIVPGTLAAESRDYGEVLLSQWLSRASDVAPR